MLQLAGAALLFGAAGYAVLGRPGLPSSPRSAEQRPAANSAHQPAPCLLRHVSADRALARDLGIPRAAEARRRTPRGILQSAVREHPGDPALWVGLGNALADHAGTLTPASELAFRRAAELAPDHPAPRFFYGLALARSGDIEGRHRPVAADSREGASRCELAPCRGGCDRGPAKAAQPPQAATGS